MKSGGGGRKEVAALLPAEAVAVVVGFVHVQAEVIQPAAAASASSPEIVPSSVYCCVSGIDKVVRMNDEVVVVVVVNSHGFCPHLEKPLRTRALPSPRVLLWTPPEA
ncbi:hypothetical protein BHM03_00060084 [Ensete ventricosum]|nr:hypothetical protein BHM03_00060084 [Ensete ventricosum]